LPFATIARLQKRFARSADVEMQAKRFFVSGRVQGVGFRYFAKDTATSLGVSGSVRNLLDGRVEVYAVGTTEQLESLRDALSRGPRIAQVYNVEEQDAQVLLQHVNGFSIEGED
jgi:acylphosphatase